MKTLNNPTSIELMNALTDLAYEKTKNENIITLWLYGENFNYKIVYNGENYKVNVLVKTAINSMFSFLAYADLWLTVANLESDTIKKIEIVY